MAIFDRVGDLNSTGLILDNTLESLVFEQYTDSPAFLTTEVPCASVAGFVVYDDWAPKWAKWRGIIVKRAQEGLTCQDGCAKRQGTKEVKSEFGLGK